MYREYAKGGGFPVRHFGNAVVPASQLERVADKEDLFGLAGRGIGVIRFYCRQPAPIGCFPLASFAVEGAAGTAAVDIDVVGGIGDLVFQANFEFVVLQVQPMSLSVVGEQFADTSHPLVGLSLIEIQNSYSN